MADCQKDGVRRSKRCPVCFARENDVVLCEEDGMYYCVKCGFTGTEADIHEMYDDMRKKYQLIAERLTVEEQRRM